MRRLRATSATDMIVPTVEASGPKPTREYFPTLAIGERTCADAKSGACLFVLLPLDANGPLFPHSGHWRRCRPDYFHEAVLVVGCMLLRVGWPPLERSAIMTNSQEKRVNRIAQNKGYRLEKIGKGAHHGRFSIMHVAEGARIASGISGAEFSFTLQEAEAWLAKVTST